MNACGLVVEYNPFHNGHLYHVNEARKVSNAQIIVAVMSGSFLQRGEPAIIDKFHRTKAALQAGVDIVIELPYPYAVQSSELFAKGAILSLQQLGVTSICFGSESGNITDFINGINQLQQNKTLFDQTIKSYVAKGYSYPKATSYAYEAIGMEHVNLIKPNNILGYNYVKTIVENNFQIKPLTIRRIHNDYHEQHIGSEIASATSIRKEILENDITEKIITTVPNTSLQQLQQYKKSASIWHHWEYYFPFLQYKVMTMTTNDLASIHLVDEGLEYRIKKTAKRATSFYDWLDRMQTNRYTRARLQRTFTHILTNTTKEEINVFFKNDIPYIRLLGMNRNGQSYLNQHKKQINTPIFTNLKRDNSDALLLDERATNIYYSVLSTNERRQLQRQEFNLPIMM